MRKSEEKRPGGGKRVRFDGDDPVERVDRVVVHEEKRKDGVKRIRFDRPSNNALKEAKP